MNFLESIPQDKVPSTLDRLLGGFASDLLRVIDRDSMPFLLCDGKKVFFSSGLDMPSISQGALTTAQALATIKSRYKIMLEDFVIEEFDERIGSLMDIHESAAQFAA